MTQRFIRWWHRKRIRAAKAADVEALREAREILYGARARILRSPGEVYSRKQDLRWEILANAEMHLKRQLDDALRYREGGNLSL